jgi:hypothetical protein
MNGPFPFVARNGIWAASLIESGRSADAGHLSEIIDLCHTDYPSAPKGYLKASKGYDSRHGKTTNSPQDIVFISKIIRFHIWTIPAHLSWDRNFGTWLAV